MINQLDMFPKTSGGLVLPEFLTFFDLETTDKNPNACEILTGYFKTVHVASKQPIDDLYITSRPEKYLKASYEIHGISFGEAMNFENKWVAFKKILNYLIKHDVTLCCHAAWEMFGKAGYFDWQVIKLQAFHQSPETFNWFNQKFRDRKVISTHTMAKEKLTLPNYSLKSISDYYGFNYKPHDCREDALVMEKNFYRLIGA